MSKMKDPTMVAARLDAEDAAKFRECVEREKLRSSDVLRRAIRVYHESLFGRPDEQAAS
jgi:hypothetical protein